jgi:hypothetical protein
VAAKDLTDHHGIKVGKSALAQASKKLEESDLLASIKEHLTQFNENTEGPTLDAIVETACDSAVSGNTDEVTVQNDLAKHLGDKLQLFEVQEIQAAQEKIDSLRQAYIQGDAGKADVILICYAVDPLRHRPPSTRTCT